MMLHIKFQGHGPIGSGEEDFLRFLPYMGMVHTCDISRFRRELPIYSLFSRSHSRETKSPDERFSNVFFFIFFPDRIFVRTFYRLRQ